MCGIVIIFHDISHYGLSLLPFTNEVLELQVKATILHVAACTNNWTLLISGIAETRASHFIRVRVPSGTLAPRVLPLVSCLHIQPPGNQHSISALFSNTLPRRDLTRQFISKFLDKLQISRMSVAAAQFPPLAQRPIAGTICLFDVDDTLTPARRVRTRLVFFLFFF